MEKVKKFFAAIWEYIKLGFNKTKNHIIAKFNLKEVLVFIGTVIFAILFLVICNFDYVRSNFWGEIQSQPLVRIKVTEVCGRSIEDLSYFREHQVSPDSEEVYYEYIPSHRHYLVFEGVIIWGENKGETTRAVQVLNYTYDSWPEDEISVGDKVNLHEYNSEIPNPELEESLSGEIPWTFYRYHRIDKVIWLAILFLVLIIVFGGFRGITAACSLGFTCLGIFFVYIPAALSGRNIYLWTLITCLFTVTITILFVVGATKKGLASAFACLCGIALGALLTVIIRKATHLTGFQNIEEYQLLLMLDIPRGPIDLRAVLFGTITIGALGAVMDVAISMCSALQELNDTAVNPSFKQTVKSGMVIGRDIIGTMANTLILAYIGTALGTSIYLMSHVRTVELFSREDVIIELVQTLIGCFTLILTVPVSTFVCAFLYNRKKKPEIKMIETEEV